MITNETVFLWGVLNDFKDLLYFLLYFKNGCSFYPQAFADFYYFKLTITGDSIADPAIERGFADIEITGDFVEPE